MLARILRDGFASEYGRVADLINPVMSNAKCQLVIDVLSMFDSLQRPYVDSGKSVPNDLLFLGFDGNGEGDLLNFAHFLMKDGRWSFLELGGMKDLNSHSPTGELYYRMLSKWKEFGSPHSLSVDQIQSILAEKIHPDNRPDHP